MRHKALHSECSMFLSIEASARLGR
jgi:hypothetical protein